LAEFLRALFRKPLQGLRNLGLERASHRLC
jgi:hypothetical protein